MPYLKLLALLTITLVFVVFCNHGTTMPNDVSSLMTTDEAQIPEPIATDTIEEARHLMRTVDTAYQRILFFGDSMVEGLKLRMDDYAEANGYKLTSVVWYSSTTQTWAETDTLSYFIDIVQPTYIMVCLGANEQFVKNVESRKAYINRIIHLIGPTPYIWIGVPAWKEDTGINQLTQTMVGKGRYFDSRSLELERSSDHIHPTFPAAAFWMDSIARWMEGIETHHPIRMSATAYTRRHKSKTYTLQPLR